THTPKKLTNKGLQPPNEARDGQQKPPFFRPLKPRSETTPYPEVPRSICFIYFELPTSGPS
ncbi:hypothetical protein, partial [Prosthecobacter sp.]|uniref:hypothetical protein n=1 Tax=Prosthecobacter sp. TaxID=1965333 RepID=UPI0025E8D6BD